MKIFTTLSAATLLACIAQPALAQTSTDTAPQSTRAQDRLNAILGTLFGNQTGTTDSIDAQWAGGRTPLATQRAQFDSRIDADVRSGALSQTTGIRLKSDYAALVQLEARYGADGRFTTSERTELADRYGDLTQAIADRGYGNDWEDDAPTSPVIAEGRAEFNARVDSSVAARRITRSQGIRLKADYAALASTEASYLRDGVLSDRERTTLDTRLDAIDVRVGDGGYAGGAPVMTPRARLDAIARALPSSGLSASLRTQISVEHEDLSRLEAAYSRLTVSADERAYLDRRLTDLETRARVRR